MIFILIILGIVFTGYIVYIETNLPKLISISESFYVLSLEDRGGIFRGFCIALMAIMIALAAKENSVFFFISSVGAAFVAVATTYNDRITGPVHFIGAGILILFACIGLASFGILWPLLLSAAGILIMIMANHLQKVYIYEIACFLFIYGGLVQHYITTL